MGLGNKDTAIKASDKIAFKLKMIKRDKGRQFILRDENQ